MADDVMLQEAISAVSQGQRRRARDLLTRLLRTDQANPTYWLWMSAVVDTTKERIFCLQNVLRLDPHNRSARQGLVLLGILPPPDDVKPLPPLRRKWVVQEQAGPPLTGLSAILANPVLRVATYLGAGVVVIGLLLLGFFGMRYGYLGTSLHLTVTPKPWTPKPTATLLPTSTPYARTATPAIKGPVPLWMKLPATYTPTPLYVNTPHPISEAYRAGVRTFMSGGYSDALNYFQQAAREDRTAADILYYIGETERLLGRPEQALAAYEDALEVNPNFGAAYLARARVQLLIKPGADISADLEAAIAADPTLGEAFIERAAMRLRQGDFMAALQDLQAVEALLPESPYLFLYRAQAYLGLHDPGQALEAALAAYQLEQTLLPAYLTLGQAYLQNGQPELALEPLETYVIYEKTNSDAWATLGQARFMAGADPGNVIDALDEALDLDDSRPLAYLFRGLAYLEQEDARAAINDLADARRLDPESYPINLAFGQALLLDGRPADAADIFTSCETLAQTLDEQAAVFYWRAQAQEHAGQKAKAAADWQALLDLAPDLADTEDYSAWLSFAQEHLTALTPTATLELPTLTPKPTRTPRPTFTLTLTRTPRPTPTPTYTRTPRPTATNSATPTNTRTPRPSPTPTATTTPTVPIPTSTPTP